MEYWTIEDEKGELVEDTHLHTPVLYTKRETAARCCREDGRRPVKVKVERIEE